MPTESEKKTCKSCQMFKDKDMRCDLTPHTCKEFPDYLQKRLTQNMNPTQTQGEPKKCSCPKGSNPRFCLSDNDCKNATDQYKCPSYYDNDNILRDCTCGKCLCKEGKKQGACAGCGRSEHTPIKDEQEVTEARRLIEDYGELDFIHKEGNVMMRIDIPKLLSAQKLLDNYEIRRELRCPECKSLVAYCGECGANLNPIGDLNTP